MSVPSDEALMAGLAAADPASAVTLVRRFQHRVYGLALTMLGDPATAEDVAQEVFTRAWRHAATYDSRRASVATWLLSITRNLAIDHLRLRRPEPVNPGLMAALRGASSDSGPAELALAGQEAGRLRDALRRLPEEQRRALVLAAIGGRTAREIGEVEGIPLGTAKTRIRTAMMRLKADLEREHEAK